jgi:hypothetical protein
MIPTVALIDLGSGLLKTLIESLTKSNVPGQIIDAASNLVSQLEAHKDDVITKANLEAQRG